MTTQERAIELIKSLEDLRLVVYSDSTGVLTIGYGTARNYPDGGNPIMLQDRCSEKEATFWLTTSLQKDIFPFVNILQEKYLFNDDVYVAISSLLYNIGRNRPGPFFYKALLANKIGNGLNLLMTAFHMYNKIRKDGKLVVCEGLVNRREKEIAVFMGGDSGI